LGDTPRGRRPLGTGIRVVVRITVGAEPAGLETIRDDPQQRGARAREGLVQTLSYIAAIPSYSTHDDHAVDLAQQRERVGDRGQRRRVDHDEGYGKGTP